MKLGSLFDGSGTAPLCAAILGWEPVWASEIEAFPVKVTCKRFPRMKHLGDITKIRGGEIEPVDAVVGGSRCQDLSVAGKQVGLQGGTRSHLFYEMVRIIKEMRRATNGKYPRYIVWENVPGAFSSNQGRDFHEVLKAFCSCADHPCDVPEPPKKGRAGADKLVWGNAGCIVGDGFSLAWRVLDAQYWGVPQRRRRIFLVVDLGGERAGEILFEREGLWRDPEQSREARESPAAAAVGSADRGTGTGSLNGWDLQSQRLYAIGTTSSGTVGVASFMGGQGEKAGGIGYSEECAPTLKAASSGTNTVPDVVYANTGAGWWNESKSAETIRTPCGGDATKANLVVWPVVARTLTGEHDASPCVDRGQNITAYTADCRSGVLNCMHDQQMIAQDAKPPRRYIVRRLTPMECCRLQGFPDWWVYGCEKQPITGWWLENNDWMRVIDPHGEIDGSDSAIYKMWGNGMALPCMLFVLSGLEEKSDEQSDSDRAADG